MNGRHSRGSIALLAVTLFLVGCVIGESSIRRENASASGIPLTTVQMPETLHRGEASIFSVKTNAGNACSASIQYGDEAGNPAADNLPEAEADQAGLCTWIWKVPPLASEGAAWFLVEVNQRGETFMPVPSAFCIEKCPWPRLTRPSPITPPPVTPGVR